MLDTWYTRLLEPDQTSNTQSMVAKKGCTNRANVQTPNVKKCIKKNSASFQAIQQFRLQLVRGDMRGDQKPETFVLDLNG